MPDHWIVHRLSFAFRTISSGTTPPSDRPELYGGDVNWVTTGELREVAISETAKAVTTQALDAFPTLRVYPSGTLLIAMYGATIGRLGWLAAPAATNQACCALADPKGIDPRFGFFVLAAAKEALILLSSGGGQPNINQEKIRAFPIPLPPLPEQATIVAFLDRETAKIDALVEEQRRLIELLKEKRQAVISHAVTKGLDPTVPMKDSGVEWLGQVPAHWEVRRIGSVSAKITNGYVGPTRDILVDQGVRYLQSLHIKRNKISFHSPYYVQQDWSEAHAKSILEAGDVLIVQTGDIGQVAVVPEQYAGCNCHALIIVSPIRAELDGSWLAWVLNGDFGFHSLLSIQTGALHPHLNCGNVKDLHVPLPPLQEQAEIVEYVVEQAEKLDALIAQAEAMVLVLQERRAALISAAVTGKIDVRDAVAKQAKAA
nr:restriction endonuclease subunit S [Novosphingobium sp. BW1]